MATPSIDALVQTFIDNSDYDLVGSSAKAIEAIKALRGLLLLKPVSVSVGSNPVSFESLKSMLEKAESWFRANGGSATGGAGVGSSASFYYDTSNVRR